MPASSLYPAVIDSDDFIFIQLGTNDRGNKSTVPVDVFRTISWLKTIVNSLVVRNKNIVLMAANAVTEDESAMAYNQSDIAREVANLAKQFKVPFIDNHAATLMLKVDGTVFLSDGLHPNDVGYRVMFDNIKDTLGI